MLSATTIEQCDDLDNAIAAHVSRGYRLDMIAPADAPAVAMLSRDGRSLRLEARTAEPQTPSTGDWVKGRAGMEYRDLLSDRLGGRLIASRIRLTKGGEVPDYVHYHKVRFQMIYCLAGSVRVVYEDQGPPFWLMPGDCVLQPPEIRHRVLEALAGSEVLELSAPAEHETWVEHDIQLPTATINTNRNFGGQRFVRHVAGNAELDADRDQDHNVSETAIGAATAGIADVRIIRLSGSEPYVAPEGGEIFVYCLAGRIEIDSAGERSIVDQGSAQVVQRASSLRTSTGPASALVVTFRDI